MDRVEVYPDLDEHEGQNEYPTQQYQDNGLLPGENGGAIIPH